MKSYTLTIRNKHLTSWCGTIAEMISEHQARIDLLKAIQRAGDVVDVDFSAAHDDYVTFSAKDPAIAEALGFSEEEADQEEC